MWMGQVKMEHYLSPLKIILLQILYALPLLNLHANFSFNTYNISRGIVTFVSGVLSQKRISWESNITSIIIIHKTKLITI